MAPKVITTFSESMLSGMSRPKKAPILWVSVVLQFWKLEVCSKYLPPSYQRRWKPAMPWMNIGAKMRFMPMSEGQKCSLPSLSFMKRPVAFGNQ
jgi:hypothetical protein